MIPHERSLVQRYQARPFTLLGINSDRSREAALAGNRKLGVTWRNLWDPKNEIAKRWNVRAWPTLYLLDHEGVVRHRWFGDPGGEVIEAAIQVLVDAAEATRETSKGR